MAVSSLAHPCCLQRRMIATFCHETLRSGATLTPKDPLPCLKVLQPRTLLTFRCSACSSHFQSDRGLSQGAPSQLKSESLLQISRTKAPSTTPNSRYRLLTTTGMDLTRPPHAHPPRLGPRKYPPTTTTIARPAFPSRSPALLHYIPPIAL